MRICDIWRERSHIYLICRCDFVFLLRSTILRRTPAFIGRRPKLAGMWRKLCSSRRTLPTSLSPTRKDATSPKCTTSGTSPICNKYFLKWESFVHFEQFVLQNFNNFVDSQTIERQEFSDNWARVWDLGSGFPKIPENFWRLIVRTPFCFKCTRKGAKSIFTP